MKIPYKTIKNQLDSNPSIDEISDIFFQLGHEHEINNEVFEMEFTPNRGDCLSLNGLIRDIAFFYKTKPKANIYTNELKKFNFKFTNKIKDACPRISFLKIEIKKIPEAYTGVLEDYFLDLELKKNNFFTDISNYLLFETGQPTHCYDSSKINGDLSLEIINKDVEFDTLLDKKISLTGNNAVFTLNNNVINLAGIIGGNSTSCSENTQEVILECAYFEPELIIGNSLKYNVQSDAAYRFERGVDPLNHEYVLRRFIQLVSDHTEIKNIELFTEEQKNIEPLKIKIEFEKIKNIIGINIENIKIEECLEKLGFKIQDSTILIPSYRSDIMSLNDIAEEVARLIGYDNIEPKNFNILNDTNKKKSNERVDKIKRYLIDNGFNEVINFPFVKENNNIELDNSLDVNKRFMRKNLKESLLENLLFNERRQKDSIKLFEISDIYELSEEIDSKTFLGIISSGRIGKDYISFHKKINKNYLNEMLSKYIDNNDLNAIEINRDKLKSKSKDKIIYYEIEIDKFSDMILHYEIPERNIDTYIQYDPISEYPSSTRDLSFSVEDATILQDLCDLILSSEIKILKEVFVFDYFNDEKNNKLKIGFRFIFQSKENTITDNEVEREMSVIINKALSIKSVSIPGL